MIVGADIGARDFAIAIAAGAVSFLSPCCLPLVPGFLAVVGRLDEAGRTRVRPLAVVAFLFGFAALFVTLGATASAAGIALARHRQGLSLLAGIGVATMGMFMLRPKGLHFGWLGNVTGRIAIRIRDAGPFMAGLAFAVAWTPCIGPMLGSILALSSSQRTVASGAALLTAYAAGLAIPFILTAMAWTRALQMTRRIGALPRLVNTSAAVLLVVVGVLLSSDRLASVNVYVQRSASSLGVDFWRAL